jgi:uncharacterized repeat protein (TIGR02543 family)
LTVTAGTGGTIGARSPANSAGCAAGSYFAGTSISVTATASAGYVFDTWTGLDASTATAITVTMPNAASTLTATFARCWTLTVTNPAGGTIGARTPDSSEGCAAGSYFAGTSISATITVTAGYVFNGWTGASTASTLTTSFSMPAAARTLSADVDRCWTLTVTAGTGGTIGARSPANSAGCAAGSYISGTSISATATSSTGYVFSGWSGPTTATTASVSFAMPNGATTLGASFTASGGGGGGGVV